MNDNNIIQILTYITTQINELKISIKKNDVNKVLIKNTLENLRSILDYIAKDLNKFLENKKSIVYFPYGLRENHFKNSVNKNLPNLGKHPKLYSVIEIIQPFKSGESWIVDLCNLTNEVKHNNLNNTEEINSNIRQFTIGNLIHCEDVENLTIENIIINGENKGGIKIKNGEVKNTLKGIDFDLVFNKKLHFLNREIEIVPFLEKCQCEIDNLCKNVYFIIK